MAVTINVSGRAFVGLDVSIGTAIAGLNPPQTISWQSAPNYNFLTTRALITDLDFGSTNNDYIFAYQENANAFGGYKRFGALLNYAWMNDNGPASVTSDAVWLGGLFLSGSGNNLTRFDVTTTETSVNYGANGGIVINSPGGGGFFDTPNNNLTSIGVQNGYDSYVVRNTNPSQT